MKKINLFKLFIIVFSICLMCYSVAFSQQITPESFSNVVKFKPYQTEIIENDDPRGAIEALDELNAKMLEEGWALFQMLEYIDGGDFQGFIAIYKKADIKVTAAQ